MSTEAIKYIKNKCEQDLQEIEEHEPWNERLKRNIKSYYDRCLTPKSFEGITRQEFEKLKQLGLDKIVFDWQAFKEMSIETMEKYGIKLHSIYEDLEKVVVHEGKRKSPLCKQVYGFRGELTEKEETTR